MKTKWIPCIIKIAIGENAFNRFSYEILKMD